MIIFGTTTLNSTRDTGPFHCPRCSMQRTYHLKSANRFFTLYFIPLIPMGSAGQWVECASCGGTYGEEVLHYNPVAERNEMVDTIRRVMILVMLDAGCTDATHIAALRGVCGQMLGAQVTDQQIYEDVRLAQEANTRLVEFVQHMLQDVTEEGKGFILGAAIRVVAPDGYLPEDKKSVIRQLGQAMWVPPQHVEQIISSGQGHIGP